ncbi:MAG: efflux RND transporter periplasmic adaptor subunit [Aestuariibacter sp.]
MKKALILIAIVSVMVGIIAIKKYREQHDVVEVKVAKAHTGILSDTVLASGNFVFNEQIQIRPEVSGRVDRIYVDEGDVVSKGDILLQLDDSAFRAEVEQVEAQIANQEFAINRHQETLRNLQRQLTRQQTLLQKGLVQQESIDDLKSQVDIAKFNVHSAQALLQQSQASLKFVQDQLRKTTFTAPMDGLIASLDIKEGETVIAGTTNIVGSDLMTVADPSVILAELRVDEADIAQVQIGQSVEIFAAAYPKLPFSGNITEIGTSAKRLGQNAGLSFSVKVLMDEAEHHLYPGMSCRAEIITDTGDTTTNVPIAAIQYDDENSFIWKVADNKAVKQTVELGMATDTEQAILDGILAEEHIIVGPARIISRLQQNDSINWSLVE